MTSVAVPSYLNGIGPPMRRVLTSDGFGAPLYDLPEVRAALTALSFEDRVRLSTGEFFPQALQMRPGYEFQCAVGMLMLAEVYRRVSQRSPILCWGEGRHILAGCPPYVQGREFLEWARECDNRGFPKPDALAKALGSGGLAELCNNVARQAPGAGHNLNVAHIHAPRAWTWRGVARDLLLVYGSMVQSMVYPTIGGQDSLRQVGERVNQILTSGACT